MKGPFGENLEKQENRCTRACTNIQAMSQGEEQENEKVSALRRVILTRGNGRAISEMTELHPQKMLETGRLQQIACPKNRVIYCAKSG